MPFLKLEDVELYYEITGEGENVLLIHGLGSSTRDWELQAPFLARHYRVIAFDVRGHGRSTKPPGPYDIALFTRDTARLVDALELAPCHVIGISMGGMIALELAVERPETVRSLVVINASAEIVPRTWREKLLYWQRVVVSVLFGMRGTAWTLSRILFPKPDQEELRRTFISRWIENDKRAYLATLRGLAGWSVAARLPQIRCPTLVLASEHDYIPAPRKRMLVEKIPNAELVVLPDSHHAVIAECPDEVNATLARFLTSC